MRSTVELARSLGLQVVAEGVETKAAWRQLGLLGCDAAQGYWLARPGPSSEVPRVIGALEERLGAPGDRARARRPRPRPAPDAAARLGA